MACPENRAVGGRFEEGPCFTEEETQWLVVGTPREALPATTTAKLDALEISLGHESLCRNLAALLDR